MQWTLVEELKDLEKTYPTSVTNQDKINLIFHRLADNKKLLMHAYSSTNHAFYRRFVKNIMNTLLEDRMASYPDAVRIPEEKRIFIIKIFSSALSNFILEWIEDGMPESYTDSISDYVQIFDIGFRGTIMKFSETK